MIPDPTPMEARARHQATRGGTTGPLLRFLLAELDGARAEIDRLQAAELEQQRQAANKEVTW